MKKPFCLLFGLLALGLHPLASAAEKSYPAKNPVFTYVAPANWTTEIDKKDGSISINSEDGMISANFTTVPAEASMEVFKAMLPAMVKTLRDAEVVEKAKEQDEDGLTGFSATYSGKIKGQSVVAIYILLEGGKDRSVLGNVLVGNPAKLSKQDSEDMESFMKSIKGVVQAVTFPKKDPVLTYITPGKWKTEVDKKKEAIAIGSEDGKVAVNFATVPVEATLEVFETMLPAMVKELEDSELTKKAREHSEDGLTGYTATYTGKIDNKPVVAIFTLFRGGKKRAVLGSFLVEDPAKLPQSTHDAMDAFMKSMKGAE